MTLNPVCESVETAQGVPLTVTGVAQVKIMKNADLLQTASEQFLGKKEHEIKSTVLQTLEGHLRAILGTLTVEEVYKDRDQFASLVREVAAPDVGRMGIEVLSFTIKDVYDNVTYLASLGKAQTAAVKRDAAIMALVLEALPQIAAEVAAPLAKTDEIVLLGGADKTTTEVNKLLGQLPPAVQALTGVDVTGALGKIPGATMKAA